MVVFILFFIVVAFSGCTSEDPESHIIFYDKEYGEKFKNALDAQEVGFRSVGDSEIFYSVRDQEKVDDIRNNLILNYPISYEIFDKVVADAFSEYLLKNSIEFTMYEKAGGGYSFILDNKYKKKSSELYAAAIARR